MPVHEASIADVLAAYSEFLGRQPESAEAIVNQLRGEPTVWDLVRRLRNCDEAQRKVSSEIAGHISSTQDPRRVEVRSTPEEAARLLAHIEQVWSRYGREEAFYSVLTDPRYLMDRISDDDLESFYQSGEWEIAGVARQLQRNNLDVTRMKSVLELGCGVGRLSLALAQRFPDYTGVDISSEHLALAQDKFSAQRRPEPKLILLSAALNESVTYDFFFSVIVLQHNPPPIIRMLLGHFLSRVNVGGIAYFQLPCHIYNYEFQVSKYLSGEGRSEGMEMHPLPQREVFDILHENGFVPVEVVPDARIGPLGFSYTFIAERVR